MANKYALVAGSFDPVTVGHLWIIKKAARLFDKVFVAVGTNPEKIGRYMFTAKQRIEMLKEAVKEFDNVEVCELGEHYIFDYAKIVNANFIVRGIRHENDFLSEHATSNTIGIHGNGIDTWFLIPPPDLVDVSSSFVKGLVGPLGWENVIKRYLTEPVWKKFVEVQYEQHY